MDIKHLPPELRELALLRRQQEKDRRAFDSDSDIMFMFEWRKTPEGHPFWDEVCYMRNIQKNNEKAKIILGKITTEYSIY